jgi:transposase
LRNGDLPHSGPKKHYKQNEKEVQKWLNITYPDIVKKAKEEDAEIYWLDETGVQNTSNYVKGYAPKGKTPTIPIATKHIRVNMISAMTNQGKLRFHFYHGKMNQDLFMGFLTKLNKRTDKKVYAITDNLNVHHGLHVKDWIKENVNKVKLFFLPPYAPELNPVEYLNNNLKYEMVKKGYSKDADEIQAKVMGTMRSLLSKKNRIAGFFENEHVTYAKNPTSNDE